MRKVLYMFGVLLAAFGLTVGLGTAAQAGADGPTSCYTSYRSCVWFVADGDKIYLQDGNADGHSAVAQVCAPSGCSYVADYLWNHEGAGEVRSYGYGTSIPEGTTVYYRPCYGEWNGGGGDESVTDCKDGWSHGTA